MHYVIGGLFAFLVVVLAVAAITGRVKARSCCAPGDPSRDRRMRAVEDEEQTTSQASTGEVRP